MPIAALHRTFSSCCYLNRVLTTQAFCRINRRSIHLLSSHINYSKPNRSRNSMQLSKMRRDKCSVFIDKLERQHVVTPDSWYLLQFDGGSRGNPGLSGAGSALYWLPGGPDETLGNSTRVAIWAKSLYVGNANTCNEAEYSGIIAGLTAAAEKGIQNLIVQGDSLLIIQQILGSYKVKSQRLAPLYIQVIKLLENFSQVQISHIDRSLNADADSLANRAMDTCQTEIFSASKDN